MLLTFSEPGTANSECDEQIVLRGEPLDGRLLWYIAQVLCAPSTRLFDKYPLTTCIGKITNNRAGESTPTDQSAKPNAYCRFCP